MHLLPRAANLARGVQRSDALAIPAQDRCI